MTDPRNGNARGPLGVFAVAHGRDAALVLLAGAALWSGAAAAPSGRGPLVFSLFCLGWVVAGVLSAGVGVVQAFAPSWTDGDWIASSGLPGRAVGNLRQPNHLRSLLLSPAIAVVACVDMRRLSRAIAAAAALRSSPSPAGHGLPGPTTLRSGTSSFSGTPRPAQTT